MNSKMRFVKLRKLKEEVKTECDEGELERQVGKEMRLSGGMLIGAAKHPLC